MSAIIEDILRDVCWLSLENVSALIIFQDLKFERSERERERKERQKLVDLLQDRERSISELKRAIRYMQQVRDLFITILIIFESREQICRLQ